MTDWTARFSRIEPRASTFGADSPPPSSKSSVARVTGIEKLSKTDLAALARAAKDLGMETDWLATVISFETGGTFSPSVLNKAGSGAFGLIQFLPSTAANLLKLPKDQAVEKGRAMSFAQQLKEMVIPYFRGGTYNSLNDVYLKVFYPAAMGQPSSKVVATAGSAVYEQNKGFDRTQAGVITVGDITSRVNAQLIAAAGLPRIPVVAATWASIFAGLALVAAGTYYLSVNTNLLPFGPNANKAVRL
jgi:hypothetical protein